MLSNQDAEEGLERLRAVVRANPRSTTFVALAHALCEAGQPGEAEEVCRQGLGQHPRLVTGQVALGRALIERGRLKEAQEVLIEAAKASPEHGDVFRWLGDAVLRQGDLEHALPLLEYAQELAPTDARVGELLVQAGGVASTRAPRPKTDFENTRVANARALAERMHEDPPAAGGAPTAPPASAIPVPVEAAQEPADDPTSISTTAAVHAWFATSVPTPGPELEKGAGGWAAPDGGAAPVEVAPVGAPKPERAGTPGPRTLTPGPGTLPPPRRPTPGPGALTPGPRTGSGAGTPGPQAAPMADTATGPGRTPLAADREQRRRRLVIGGLSVGAVVVFGLALFRPGSGGRGGAGAPGLDFDRALAAGTLEALETVRAAGKQRLARGQLAGEGAAALALVNGFLALDYGLPVGADVDEAARVATERAAPGTVLVAHAAAARALAALAEGDLGRARTDAGQAMAIAPESRVARLASARVRLRAGELEQARADLEKALARDPDFAPAVLDWATLWLDLGDPTAASTTLRALLERRKDHLPARLLLAEADRAAGVAVDAKGLREVCRHAAGDNRLLRARCALAEASAARLAGERVPALKAARLALATGASDPRIVAQAALLLATLGEIDVAMTALDRARNKADPGFVPRAWAEAAVHLGRGEPVAPGPLFDRPISPEARLVVARATLASAGSMGLVAALRKLGPAVAGDPDLRLFAALGQEPRPAGAKDKPELEVRADKGDPLASYLAGRIAHRAGDTRTAARRLERALQGHGDTCEAARLLLSVHGGTRPPSLAGPFKALRARNGKCDLTRPAAAP